MARRDEVSIQHAVGRIAARDYRSPIAVPPFARATWDGYAVRAHSTRGASDARPRRLRIVGEVFAEGGFDGAVGAGQAVAIATGGALPSGTDTVVAFEEVRVDGTNLSIFRSAPAGERIVRRGEDLRRGARIVRAGESLTPAGLGSMAVTGQGRVSVWARPVVTLLPNGSELVRPGRGLARGQIYESNNASLSAIVEGSGGIVRTSPPIADDPDRIESAIRRALRSSDLVIVTGGSSVGERDYLPTIFPRLGRVLFHGIAIRPGKPTLAVQADGRVVVGMPGHPASCLSNGFWLLLPALRRLGRIPGEGWVDRTVRLSQGVDLPSSGFATVIPLEVRGDSGRPTFHDSSAISSLGGANAFSVWPGGRAAPRRGSRLIAHVLTPPLGAASW